MNFVGLLLVAPPILLALSFHEYAHAYVAYRLGDPTAAQEGRLTMNPLAHLDPIGTIMIFLVHFGWARPVPVNPLNLTDPKRDMLWISLAGPVSNMILALLFGMALRFALFFQHPLDLSTFGIIQRMMVLAVVINIALAFFNLIPLPPLDGSKILFGLLPPAYEETYLRFQRFGPMLLIGLVLMGSVAGVPIISMFLMPFIGFFSSLFVGRSLTHFF